MFFTTWENYCKNFFSSNLVNLDLDLDSDPDLYPDLYPEPDLYQEPDPHSEKLLDLDPDPHKMNADPHPWNFIRWHHNCKNKITFYLFIFKFISGLIFFLKDFFC